jgi:hypothetical protein
MELTATSLKLKKDQHDFVRQECEIVGISQNDFIRLLISKEMKEREDIKGNETIGNKTYQNGRR